MALYYLVYIDQDPANRTNWLAFPTLQITHNLASLSTKYKPFTEKPGAADDPVTDEAVARKEMLFVSIHKKFMATTGTDITPHTLHQLLWIEQQKLSFDGSIHLIRYKDGGDRVATGIAVDRLYFTAQITSHVTGSQDMMGFNFAIVGGVTLEEEPIAARAAPRGRDATAIA